MNALSSDMGDRVHVSLTCRETGPMTASLASLEHVSGGSFDRVTEFFRGVIDGSNDGAGLFRCEFALGPAGGTGELVSIEVLPSQTFLDLVSALAGESENVSVVMCHGWPILSVAGDTATVAEAGAVTSRLGGWPA